MVVYLDSGMYTNVGIDSNVIIYNLYFSQY